MRLNCAKIARLGGAALLAVCVAGCQSNAERDLVARDRRMQEDQMWAMQDYLQQYQQLICRFRSENASLRRQLNVEHGGAVVDGESLPGPGVPSNPPVLNRAPDLPDLSPRSSGNKQAPSPNIDIPDLPPLNQGSSTNMPNSYESLAH